MLCFAFYPLVLNVHNLMKQRNLVSFTMKRVHVYCQKQSVQRYALLQYVTCLQKHVFLFFCYLSTLLLNSHFTALSPCITSAIDILSRHVYMFV